MNRHPQLDWGAVSKEAKPVMSTVDYERQSLDHSKVKNERKQ